MKKSAATQVRHLHLTKYIEGKQFADGVHQILTRKDGKKILLRLKQAHRAHLQAAAWKLDHG